jgi:hypothetical protein
MHAHVDNFSKTAHGTEKSEASLTGEGVMTARAPYLKLVVVGLVVTACDRGPQSVAGLLDRPSPLAAAPTAVAPAVTGSDATGLAGTTKEPIRGTIEFAGADPAGKTIVTPSGRCHLRNSPVHIHFTGDVSGTVTIRESLNLSCDFTDLVGSGPFEGTVTWNGLTGVIEGQWTTNCNADSAQPLGLSCDGTMNARGTGALDGVQFHFSWGPGWYPFPYSGTAFSR